MHATKPTPCFHCGLPVPAGQRFCSEVLAAPREFCCPGCQAIAQLIVSGGLDGFYRHRTDISVNPHSLVLQPLDALQLFDRVDVQQAFVRRQGPSAEITLMIEGISCAACGWLIERHLQGIDGVLEARLNLSSHRLFVQWHDAELPLSQLINKLQNLGYIAHPWQADRATEQLARDNRQALRQLGVAGLLWFQAMMATMATWPQFNLDLSPELHTILRWVAMFLTTPIVFYSCRPFFKGAARDLRTRQLTMDVSVSLAIGGAYAAGIWTAISGSGELYFDAVGMFALLLLTGRYLERRARERTASATAQLVNLLPASCLRLNANGVAERVLLSDLRVDQRVQVLPGSLIPADGCILAGQSSIDESLLTGEYLPQRRSIGEYVTAGTLNVDGPLTVQVRALGSQTRLSAIVRLLERAQSEKPRLARLADRAAQVFLLVSLILAVLVGLLWSQLDPQRALWVVLAMLVATCPCALSLATPTALTAATGSLHRLGLLITRGHVLEDLARIDTVIFDKTGTLTEGRLSLREIIRLGPATSEQCLQWSAALEHHSEHPIARAFGSPPSPAEHVVATPAAGLQGEVDGRLLRIGTPAYVCELSQTTPPPIPVGTGQCLLLGDSDGPCAWLVLDDPLRSDALALLDTCRARGWQTCLLSGDPSPMVDVVARQLGIDQARGAMSPDAKLAYLLALQQQGRRVLMIGDGVNDVPVLAAADIGIAMGSATDLARVTADAVLLSNRLLSLVDGFTLADRTRRVIHQNLVWAGLYNGCMLPFAALGWLGPAWAAAGMSISSLTVVLNALRLTRLKETRPCPRST